jgi:hypothetical protein
MHTVSLAIITTPSMMPQYLPPPHRRTKNIRNNYGDKVRPKNNPYGNNGKQKCTSCRKRKVCFKAFLSVVNIKCEYETPGVPCEFCVKSGLNCSFNVTGPSEREDVTQSPMSNEIDSATTFLRQHGRALEQVHQRLLHPNTPSKARFDMPVDISPSDSEAISNDLVSMLSKRFPSLEPEYLQNEVRKVAITFGCELKSSSASSSPRSTTTAATSPDPVSHHDTSVS